MYEKSLGEKWNPMKNKYRRLTLAVFGSFALCMILSACNTVEGAGKDIKSSGEAIEEAAK
jgi:predicted small secreted protein